MWIPGYTIERMIGYGGVGKVYLARDDVFDRSVAIKVLHEHMSADAHVRERFVKEAVVMKGLSHSNIVSLYDFLEEPEPCLVMEYVEGRSLDQVIGEDVGPIPPDRALRLFHQILHGISYAHAKGIIHRDIKPANILVSHVGAVKITDLGIAKITGGGGMTRTGIQMGTLYYESPEQIKGAKNVDIRSDIYSLGITLYEMLAGRLPFDADENHSEFDVMEKIVNRKVLFDPRDHYPHIPFTLVKAVQKATEVDPEKRFQNCFDFQQALKNYTAMPLENEEIREIQPEKVKVLPNITTDSHKSDSTQNSDYPKNVNKCHSCGAEVNPDHTFCPKCGKVLLKMCPVCSRETGLYHRFCSACGLDLSTVSFSAIRIAEEREKNNEKNTNQKEIWKLISIVEAIILLVIVLLISIPKN